MQETGRFKLRSRNRAFEAYENPACRRMRRDARWIDALCKEILSVGEAGRVRLRQIVAAPAALYRLELDRPDLAYQRIALLDAESVRVLLHDEAVRSVVRIRRTLCPPQLP